MMRNLGRSAHASLVGTVGPSHRFQQINRLTEDPTVIIKTQSTAAHKSTSVLAARNSPWGDRTGAQMLVDGQYKPVRTLWVPLERYVESGAVGGSLRVGDARRSERMQRRLD